MRFRGLIFDMDGTMVDNMMIHHEAWKIKLNSLGLNLSLDEVRRDIHGVNLEILEKLFGDQYSLQEREQIALEKELEYQKIFLPKLKLIEGLPRFLKEIQDHQVPIGIGTAAPPTNVDFIMNNIDMLSFIKSIVHSGHVTDGKPNPEVFNKVAQQIGVLAKECIVFEDTVSGAQTAANAGAKAIIITTTHQPEEFSHFDHILEFIPNYTNISLSYLNQRYDLVY